MIVKGITIRNVYYMLSYAFRALRQSVYDKVRSEEFDHAEDLFGGILAVGIAHLLKHGLHRTYEEQEDDLPELRGRILMKGTMSQVFNRRKLISCSFDEFSADNLFNQILKSTALALLRTGKLKKSGNGLKRVLLNLGDVREVDLRHVRWTSLRYERNNQHYFLLINICRLVVDGLLMSEGVVDGRMSVRQFEIDDDNFAALYEGFIRNYYSINYPRLHSNASQIEWAVPAGTDKTLLPTMRSDVMLRSDAQTLILDAKFYRQVLQEYHGVRSARNAHLYQVCAYVNNYAANHPDMEVSGMLLYAKTSEEDLRPANWKIGGRDISIGVLDLSQPFVELAKTLDEVVERHFPHVRKVA